MKVLLDIDDTALIYNKKKKIWEEHPRLHELIKKHSVFLYSGNEKLEYYYALWKTKGFIPKGLPNMSSADVLIDNNADMEVSGVDVKKSYKSINAFFARNK